MTGVDTKHPQYIDALPVWERLLHTFDGQDVVKDQKTKYLLPTNSMTKRGALTGTGPGWEEYLRYRDRSVFPEFVSEAIGHLLGVMHRKEPEIVLPESMESLRETASPDGAGLEALLRRINKNQILFGRYGLLVDIADGETVPHIVGYRATDIVNWDEDRSLVVLDESTQEREGFEWKDIDQFLVLELVDGKYTASVHRIDQEEDPKPIVPEVSGKPFIEIPFVFVNAGDLTTDVDKSPMDPLSNQCLSIYRGEADYRQGLHMQGQSTLVIIGAEKDDEDVEVGAGAVIWAPTDAKFIGVDPTGLPEMRMGIENDRKVAVSMGAKLLDPDNEGSRASGDALRTRVSAHTANLARIALTGAEALQDALRIIAVSMGEDPDAVKVEPNIDFVDSGMSGKDVADLMLAKGLGAPLSLESIHKKMSQGDVTTFTFEEEKALTDNEEVLPGNEEDVNADNE